MTGITASGAVLNGTVNAGGESTVVTFKYGLDVAYGTTNGTVKAAGASTTVSFEFGIDTNYGSARIADQSPVSGSTNHGASYTLSGLNNNTVYHYRVVAQKALGTTYGADRTFITGSEEIPTLSEYGIMLLILLLGASGVFIMKRKEDFCEPTGLA